MKFPLSLASSALNELISSKIKWKIKRNQKRSNTFMKMSNLPRLIGIGVLFSSLQNKSDMHDIEKINKLKCMTLLC